MFSMVPDEFLNSDVARQLFSEIGRTLENDIQNSLNSNTRNQQSSLIPPTNVEAAQNLGEMFPLDMLPFELFVRRRRRSPNNEGETPQIPLEISEREIHGIHKTSQGTAERDIKPQSYVNYLLGPSPSSGSSSSSGDKNATQIKEPLKETIKEPIKEPLKEPVKEPLKEPIKVIVKDPIKEPLKEPITEPLKETEKETLKESDTQSTDDGDDSKPTENLGLLPAVINSTSTTISNVSNKPDKEENGDNRGTETEENEGGLIPFISTTNNAKPPDTSSANANTKEPSGNSNGGLPGFIPIIGNKNNSSSSYQNPSSGNDNNSNSNPITNVIPSNVNPTSFIPFVSEPNNSSTPSQLTSGYNSNSNSNSQSMLPGFTSMVPGLSGGGEGGGVPSIPGGGIPGLSSFIGGSKGSEPPTVYFGGFSVLKMPLSPENIALAMQSASQLTSLMQGAGGANALQSMMSGGMSNMIPGMG